MTLMDAPARPSEPLKNQHCVTKTNAFVENAYCGKEQRETARLPFTLHPSSFPLAFSFGYLVAIAKHCLQLRFDRPAE